ncbi:O-antigen ligase family protein [Bradyrhizobium sp. ARR65]|uniref:O-antigen ligase family protein n=1 Tax=Bradyrhizobium sp. ARR65 TaxID=1040989 RepID=UPI000466E22B|nr:O-antigen ligase family protein [Bradyrhizobium sp. ARR65]
MMIGIGLPPAEIYIGGMKFTPGRIAIVLLIVPAFVRFFQGQRRIVAADLFACALSAWIVLATTAGKGSLDSSAFAVVLEFFGSYLIARAYFFGPTALKTLVGAFEATVVALVLIGTIDTISGRNIVYDTVSQSFGTGGHFVPQYRFGIVRSLSTFQHSILFGSFCSVMMAILLYVESGFRRVFFVGFSFVGTLLSIASAALLASALVAISFCYDRLLKNYSWRWTACWLGAATLFAMLSIVSDNPVKWVILHMTLDPDSGYTRLVIWNSAFDVIPQSPLIGFGFSEIDMDVIDHTIDCVWLVTMLRFGIPALIFLILLNATALPRSVATFADDPFMGNMRIGLILMLACFMCIGITVHFWLNLWEFWGFCIGVSASVKEYHLRGASAADYSQSRSHILSIANTRRQSRSLVQRQYPRKI